MPTGTCNSATGVIFTYQIQRMFRVIAQMNGSIRLSSTRSLDSVLNLGNADLPYFPSECQGVRNFQPSALRNELPSCELYIAPLALQSGNYFAGSMDYTDLLIADYPVFTTQC